MTTPSPTLTPRHDSYPYLYWGFGILSPRGRKATGMTTLAFLRYLNDNIRVVPYFSGLEKGSDRVRYWHGPEGRLRIVQLSPLRVDTGESFQVVFQIDADMVPIWVGVNPGVYVAQMEAVCERHISIDHFEHLWLLFRDEPVDPDYLLKWKIAENGRLP